MSKHYKLPEKWAVEVTKDNREELGRLRSMVMHEPSGYFTSLPTYSGTSPFGRWEKGLPSNDKFTLLTLEELKELLVNKDRKIVGYKAPYDLFNGVIEAGTIYKLGEPISSRYYPVVPNITSIYNLPGEIVETWEPVYEGQFEVGRWIVSEINEIARILQLPDKYRPGYYCEEVTGRGFNSELVEGWRVATSDEIKEALIKESERRGFKEGAYIEPVKGTGLNSSPFDKKVVGSEKTYNYEEDRLETIGMGVFTLYEKGVWATLKPKEEKKIFNIRYNEGTIKVEVSRMGIRLVDRDEWIDTRSIREIIKVREWSHYMVKPHTLNIGCKNGIIVEDCEKVLAAYDEMIGDNPNGTSPNPSKS